MNGEIKIEEIAEIEGGALGVRVTLVDGKRRFIEGKEGFELLRRYQEAKDVGKGGPSTS